MKELKTAASRLNKWLILHNEEMSLILFMGGIGLIIISLLPKKYAGFKAFMVGYAILPLPY